MGQIDELYASNIRKQRGIVALASGVGLLLALAPHNERAIFIVDGVPSAFGAVPVESPPAEATTLITGGAGYRGPGRDLLDPRFLRAVGGRPGPSALPGGPASVTSGPAGVTPAAPDIFAAPSGPGTLPGPGVQLAGLSPGGPFVGSPLGPGFTSSPVGPAVIDPVAPTPEPTPTATPTPAPTGTPTPTPTATPGPEPTPTPVPSPTPVDPIVPPVPEPTTWLLMIVGFFGCGSLLRRARSAKVQAIATEGDELQPG